MANVSEPRYRRQIERSLHERVEVPLVLLSLKLASLARSQQGELQLELAELRDELMEVIEQLREVNRDVYPVVLEHEGLIPALQLAAARAPIPTRVEADSVDRHTPEVEAGVYFDCIERLSDLARSAGRDSTATVRVEEAPGSLRLQIELDGGELPA
jgi:signal transduction histidine kinase